MKPEDVSARAWDFAREQIESTAIHDERAFVRRRRMARMFDKATAELREALDDAVSELGSASLGEHGAKFEARCLREVRHGSATLRAYTPEDDDGQ